jgi:hypothetical protein
MLSETGLLLEMAASGCGARVALGPLAGGMTFEDLQIRALGGASIVADRAPSHVVFVGRNGPAYVQAFLSAAVAGVPFVPLNYRLAPAQLHALMSELTGSLIIADRASAGMFDEGSVAICDDFVDAASAAPQRASRPGGDCPGCARLCRWRGNGRSPGHQRRILMARCSADMAVSMPVAGQTPGGRPTAGGGGDDREVPEIT